MITVQQETFGFPTQQLNIPPWSIQFKTTKPIQACNVYRKVMMSEIPIYKLQVNRFETNDKFIIREFIQTRIAQIPIKYDPTIKSISINLKNNLYEPLYVTTDHFYTQQNGNRVSVEEDLKLCDNYVILKLQEHCSLQIDMQYIQQNPEQDDKHRSCFISVFEDESTINEKDDKYISSRPESIILFRSYGVFFPADLNRFSCYQFILNHFQSQNNQIQITIDKQQTDAVFNNTPLYFIDAILVYIRKELFNYYKQITPTKTNNYQTVLILMHANDTPFLQKQQLLDLFNTTINKLCEDVQQIEQQAIDSYNKYV